MAKRRGTGFKDAHEAQDYDGVARWMRDNGWNAAKLVTDLMPYEKDILEIGPGYAGLELAKKYGPVSLTIYDNSEEVLKLAEKNARKYEIEATITEGLYSEMPFGANTFGIVVSIGSLRDWGNPARVFNEIARVLRPGGRFLIADLRRDSNFFMRQGLLFSTQPSELRPALREAMKKSHSKTLLREVLKLSELKSAEVKLEKFGLCAFGKK